MAFAKGSLPGGAGREGRPVLSHGPAASSGRRCRSQELMGAGIRDRHDVGRHLRLAQPLVIHKKEDLVFLDGTAEAAAKLVLVKRRSALLQIEEVAVLQLV